MAGLVPAWLSGVCVVLFSAERMSDPSGTKVHAVKVPTFADPAGPGALFYVVVADAQVPPGPGTRGTLFVTPDGTEVDAEGTCVPSPEACDGERRDGLDLKAELLSAIRPRLSAAQRPACRESSDPPTPPRAQLPGVKSRSLVSGVNV